MAENSILQYCVPCADDRKINFTIFLFARFCLKSICITFFFLFAVTSTSTESTTTLVTSSSLSPNRANVCALPKHFGTCLTESIRFYHDPNTNTCKKFRYSGCGGNGNNFLSGEECVRTCGGLLSASVFGPPPGIKT